MIGALSEPLSGRHCSFEPIQIQVVLLRPFAHGRHGAVRRMVACRSDLGEALLPTLRVVALPQRSPMRQTATMFSYPPASERMRPFEALLFGFVAFFLFGTNGRVTTHFCFLA